MQAPIGGVSNPHLAAAVSNAGGLGSLSATWRQPDELRALLQQTQRLTSRPFAANLILDFDISENLKICLAEQVPNHQLGLGRRHTLHLPHSRGWSVGDADCWKRKGSTGCGECWSRHYHWPRDRGGRSRLGTDRWISFDSKHRRRSPRGDGAGGWRHRPWQRSCGCGVYGSLWGDAGQPLRHEYRSQRTSCVSTGHCRSLRDRRCLPDRSVRRRMEECPAPSARE